VGREKIVGCKEWLGNWVRSIRRLMDTHCLMFERRTASLLDIYVARYTNDVMDCVGLDAKINIVKRPRGGLIRFASQRKPIYIKPCHRLAHEEGTSRRDALTSKSRATDEHPSPPTCRPTLWASPIRRSWDLKKSFFHSRYLIKMKWKTSLFEVEHFLFDVREQRVHYWRETSQPEHDVGIIIWEFRPGSCKTRRSFSWVPNKKEKWKERKQENKRIHPYSHLLCTLARCALQIAVHYSSVYTSSNNSRTKRRLSSSLQETEKTMVSG
jgi:hypothetical protein